MIGAIKATKASTGRAKRSLGAGCAATHRFRGLPRYTIQAMSARNTAKPLSANSLPTIGIRIKFPRNSPSKQPNVLMDNKKPTPHPSRSRETPTASKRGRIRESNIPYRDNQETSDYNSRNLATKIQAKRGRAR